MVSELTANSIYIDLKQAAEARSIWQTLQGDFHKPDERADHRKMFHTTTTITAYTVECSVASGENA